MSEREREPKVIDAEFVVVEDATSEFAEALGDLGFPGAKRILADIEHGAREVHQKVGAMTKAVRAGKALGKKLSDALPRFEPRPVVPRDRPR